MDSCLPRNYNGSRNDNKKQEGKEIGYGIFLTITLLPSIPSTTTLAPSSTALFSTSIAGHSSPPIFT